MSGKIAVIGAGPAGSHLSYLLSKNGRDVTVFELKSPHKKKPCAGGLTYKLFSDTDIPEDLPIPARRVRYSRIVSWDDTYVDITLQHPVTVVTRKDFDRYLLGRSLKFGTRLINSRVKSVERAGNGWVVSAGATSEQYDFIIGADGIKSLVRNTVSVKFRTCEFYKACGYYVKELGEDKIVIKFFHGFHGYAWVFPGIEYASAGICGTGDKYRTPHLKAKLAEFLMRYYSKDQLKNKSPFSWFIPSMPLVNFNRLEIAGKNWALAGDAAGLADPITGEGIYYAISSAEILATCLLANTMEVYPSMIYERFGQNLSRAAFLKNMFFAPGFIENTVILARAGPAMQAVLSDLYSGSQDYISLKRRIVRSVLPCMKDVLCTKKWRNLGRAFGNVTQIATKFRPW